MPRPRKPPRLWKRPSDGRWVIIEGRRQRRTGTADEGQAMIAFASYMQETRTPGGARRRDGNKTPTPRSVRFDLRAALRRARDRARRKGYSCTITEEHLLNLYLDGGARCAITGIPFRDWHDGDSRCNPFACSIDKINPRGGYDPGNVRLVLFCINLALADFGEAVFREVFGKMIEAAMERASSEIPDKRSHVINIAPRRLNVVK